MNIAWSAASFCYYMIGFYLKYIPGDVFTNIMVASLSEFFSCIISGMMAHKIGLTRSLGISFTLGLVAAIPLVFIQMAKDPNTQMLVVLCVLVSKFGITSGFNICYLANVEYFPVVYSSTVFGACNIIARFASVLAPLIAEEA